VAEAGAIGDRRRLREHLIVLENLERRALLVKSWQAQVLTAKVGAFHATSFFEPTPGEIALRLHRRATKDFHVEGRKLLPVVRNEVRMHVARRHRHTVLCFHGGCKERVIARERARLCKQKRWYDPAMSKPKRMKRRILSAGAGMVAVTAVEGLACGNPVSPGYDMSERYNLPQEEDPSEATAASASASSDATTAPPPDAGVPAADAGSK
jgi:hypothetical protein